MGERRERGALGGGSLNPRNVQRPRLPPLQAVLELGPEALGPPWAPQELLSQPARD